VDFQDFQIVEDGMTFSGPLASDEDGEWAILKDASTGPFRQAWNRHQILFMVLAALIVRLILVLCVFRDQTNPADNHAQFGWEMGWIARSIALKRGFSSPFFVATGPTALVPPLVPYLLAGVFHLFGLYTVKAAFVILSINSLLSALTCLPIYYGARYSLGQKIATVAGWGWAFHPYSIYFSGARIWDYALTGLLFTTCFWAALRLHRMKRWPAWLGFGVLFGITALSNPSVLSMFPVLLLLVMFAVRRRRGRWLGHSLVATLGLFAVLSPWTIRNYRVLHVLAPVRDNFWLEFWPGNNGNTFESNDHLARPPSSLIELEKFASIGERPYLVQTRVLAVNFVRQHPLLFLQFTLHRIVCYWTGYWSFSRAYLQDQPTEIPNMFFSIALLLLMLRGAQRLWSENKTAVLPYVCLIAVFPAIYYLTHVMPDYRQPIEPEITVLVAAGILSLKRREEPVASLEAAVEEESRVPVLTIA
jgi:4-amino-4-deoxy-L-arabinose transferase-like glycosyltransferase